jgi:8-oxo-dGTP diphosphatase
VKFDDKYDAARPYLASFVILRKGSKVAMVLRQNTGWMDGHYGLPAGKVEWQETYEQCAVREAKEEAGVAVRAEKLRFVHLVHRHGEEGEIFMDWVDVYFEADEWDGEPHNAEPDKSTRLDWLDLNDLPENIVPPQRQALLDLAAGKLYSEFGWAENRGKAS